MAQITLPYTLSDGNIAYALQVMQNFNTLVARINSGVEADNIADDAVTTAKILDANVTEDKIANDAVTDVKIGERTLVPELPVSDTGELLEILQGLAFMIQQVSGETDWKDTPETSLKALITLLNSASGAEQIGGAVSGLTGTDVQALLNSLKTLVDTKSASADVYTKTELNAGQLDNRYYTETELNAGQLDNRYYTETELNAGQLNTLYNTKAQEAAQTASSSGARLIGVEATTTFTAGTLLSVLQQIDQAIQDIVAGVIVDGSITNLKLAPDVKVGSLANLTTTEKGSVVGAVNENVTAIGTVSTNLSTHINATMPHITTDPVTLKVYRYGLAVEDGVWGYRWEEIV